ncbi:MAG: Hsp70 family protein, partial [Ilumatobacteraceae bacterium]
MGYQLGVDLGTTYTAAAVGRDGRAEVGTLGASSPVMPSVVLLRADGEVLVGEVAVRRGLAEPTRVAREFKRRLGDPTPLVLGGTPYGAESLMGHLLRDVVRTVSQREGEAPERVVLTHPANYGPYKLDMMREVA